MLSTTTLTSTTSKDLGAFCELYKEEALSRLAFQFAKDQIIGLAMFNHREGVRERKDETFFARRAPPSLPPPKMEIVDFLLTPFLLSLMGSISPCLEEEHLTFFARWHVALPSSCCCCYVVVVCVCPVLCCMLCIPKP